MEDQTPFMQLMGRLQEGDEDAALLLVLHYGERFRAIVRRLIMRYRIERTVRESDVMQSVWAAVFERARRREIRSHTDEELLKLLIKIARNKVARHARYAHQACRDVRRVIDEPVEALDPPDPDSDLRVCESEVLERFRAALAALPRLHRELLLEKQKGTRWRELAADWGISPDAVRKKYERIMAKLREELCGPGTPGAEPPSRRRDGDGGGPVEPEGEP